MEADKRPSADILPFRKRQPERLPPALDLVISSRSYRRLVSVAGVAGMTVNGLVERLIERGLDGE